MKMDKSIVFFDLETTGLDPLNDRIVSIAAIKLLPNGETIKKYHLINPNIPISKDASNVHGITNEMLKDKPTFKQIMNSLYEFLYDSYLIGFNNLRYDNIILQEEFIRNGKIFHISNNITLDAYQIFTHFEKRNLEAAYKFYCNKPPLELHNAENDVQMTMEVFFQQINKYDDLKGKSFKEISKELGNLDWVDSEGKIIIKNGKYIWNFGKKKGNEVINDLGYVKWVLNNNFSNNLKLHIKKIIKENE